MQRYKVEDVSSTGQNHSFVLGCCMEGLINEDFISR